MNQKIRLLQLSDLHIGPDTALVYGVDARANFETALDAVRGEHFDLMVLSGDLAQDGSEEAYRYLAQSIANLPWPAVAIAGNHDDPTVMRRILPSLTTFEEPGFLGFVRDFGALRLVGLDTANQVLPPQQIEWLRRVTAGVEREVLVFLHHPPRLVGCRFMDSQAPLHNTKMAWRELCTVDTVRHIFCGHYHTHRSVSVDGRSLHLCPSTLGKIDPDSEALRVDHTRPGWRIIEWDGVELRTWIGHAD